MSSEGEAADRALVAACARGEHAAFETLLARHRESLRAGCARALGARAGPAALEEAEAEALSRLWRDAARFFGSFRFSCPLEAWLRLMAYRTAMNWLAAERLRRGSSAVPEIAEVPPDPVEAEEELARLQKALGRMDGTERKLLEGAYFEGLGYRALAQRLGLAPGSIGPLLTRAREKLGRFLS